MVLSILRVVNSQPDLSIVNLAVYTGRYNKDGKNSKACLSDNGNALFKMQGWGFGARQDQNAFSPCMDLPPQIDAFSDMPGLLGAQSTRFITARWIHRH